MAGGREPAMPVASVRLGPFVLGPNTLSVGLHGFVTLIVLVFAAFLFGAIVFTKNADAKTVRRPKISAACSGRCCC
jgi:hypothetical protein